MVTIYEAKLQNDVVDDVLTVRKSTPNSFLAFWFVTIFFADSFSFSFFLI